MSDQEELFSRNDPAQDAADFYRFQQDTLASDARADVRDAQAAARDAAQVISGQARVKGIVDAMDDIGLVDSIREYYDYDQQPLGVQAVIDRYIINPGILNAPSGKLPYFSMTHSSVQTQQKPQGNTGGYKSKSKSKKSRYNKKSKTNKMRRSRSNKRYRSNKRHRS